MSTCNPTDQNTFNTKWKQGVKYAFLGVKNPFWFIKMRMGWINIFNPALFYTHLLSKIHPRSGHRVMRRPQLVINDMAQPEKHLPEKDNSLHTASLRVLMPHFWVRPNCISSERGRPNLISAAASPLTRLWWLYLTQSGPPISACHANNSDRSGIKCIWFDYQMTRCCAECCNGSADPRCAGGEGGMTKHRLDCVSETCCKTIR